MSPVIKRVPDLLVVGLIWPTTHISIDEINGTYYNTILKGFYYILIILFDH